MCQIRGVEDEFHLHVKMGVGDGPHCENEAAADELSSFVSRLDCAT